MIIRLSSCLCLRTINIPKPKKTWSCPETQWFSLPLSGSHKTHTHFLSRHNHIIFKPLIPLGNGKSDFWKFQTFRFKFQLMVNDFSFFFFLAFLLPTTGETLFVPLNPIDNIYLSSFSSQELLYILFKVFFKTLYLKSKFFQ